NGSFVRRPPTSPCGPEPCTSTKAENGPSPTGTVRVPGNSNFPVVKVNGCSLNKFCLAYPGGFHGGGGAWCGWKLKPPSLPSVLKTTVASRAEFSNLHSIFTTCSPCTCDVSALVIA